MSWGTLEKGGDAWVMQREEAIKAGIPGPLTEELVLFYTVSKEGCAIQCSRAQLADILRALEPVDVKLFSYDAQLEAAVGDSAGVAAGIHHGKRREVARVVGVEEAAEVV